MKKFFSIVAISMFISSTLMSCSKQQVLDTIRNNPANLPAAQQVLQPQLINISQDGMQAVVLMPNGQQQSVRTLIQPLYQNGVRIHPGQNGTGIMVNTPCSPERVTYDPVTGQPIAEGFRYNQGMSADRGTVYGVKMTWLWNGVSWVLQPPLGVEPISGTWSPAINPSTWVVIQWYPGWFYLAQILAGPGEPIIRL
jgi:hypothetical protein